MTQDVSLYDPVQAANIVNRFNAFVVPVVNDNITWGTDAVPFTEMPTSYFGGTTSGVAELEGAQGLSGTINAGAIYNVCYNTVKTWSRVRKLRAKLNVTVTGGSPWNRGTRSAPGGIVFDETNYAYMSSAYQQTPTAIPVNDLITGYLITRAGLQGGNIAASGGPLPAGTYLSGFLTACASTAQTFKDKVTTVTITVCHVSCHNSCHSSRSRR